VRWVAQLAANSIEASFLARADKDRWLRKIASFAGNE
jgi:adenosine deaminase